MSYTAFKTGKSSQKVVTCPQSPQGNPLKALKNLKNPVLSSNKKAGEIKVYSKAPKQSNERELHTGLNHFSETTTANHFTSEKHQTNLSSEITQEFDTSNIPLVINSPTLLSPPSGMLATNTSESSSLTGSNFNCSIECMTYIPPSEDFNNISKSDKISIEIKPKLFKNLGVNFDLKRKNVETGGTNSNYGEEENSNLKTNRSCSVSKNLKRFISFKNMDFEEDLEMDLCEHVVQVKNVYRVNECLLEGEYDFIFCPSCVNGLGF